MAHFDAAGKPPPENAEVLKRAGLVMALTAWETYVEDRVLEAVTARMRVVDGSYVGKFVLHRLEEELRRFHNPTAEKTRKLFSDFLEVDVTAKWEWQHVVVHVHSVPRYLVVSSGRANGSQDEQGYQHSNASYVDDRDAIVCNL